MKNVIFIGYGAMAQSVLANLPEHIHLQAVIVTKRTKARLLSEKQGGQEDGQDTHFSLPKDTQICTDVSEVSGQPDLVLEMAGQAGLRAHALNILERGWPLAVISVGALVDTQLMTSLQSAARCYQSKLYVLAGAVAGMDGLNAASMLGLQRVTYEGRKPPKSWRDSHAETMVDLDTLTQATVFFKGTAREAAKLFPANANVAATIGLAGMGLDQTRVELIADPMAEKNTHTIKAQGAFGKMQIQLDGVPLASNPRTSTLAALSVVRACKQLVESVVIV